MFEMTINVSRAWPGGSLSRLTYLNTMFIASPISIVVCAYTAYDSSSAWRRLPSLFGSPVQYLSSHRPSSDPSFLPSSVLVSFPLSFFIHLVLRVARPSCKSGFAGKSVRGPRSPRHAA